jgi:hypothetical protein
LSFDTWLDDDDDDGDGEEEEEEVGSLLDEEDRMIGLVSLDWKMLCHDDGYNPVSSAKITVQGNSRTEGNDNAIGEGSTVDVR